MIRNLLYSAAILTFAGISPLRAQGHACENAQTQVTGADPDLAGHVCKVVDRALEQLAQCHLAQKDPLTINIVDGFSDDRPGCVGIFDCANDRIEILQPEVMGKSLEDNRRFSRLPLMSLFDSVVAHELTHALVYQNLGEDSGSWAQNEYMAYAMQMAFLSSEDRALFMQGFTTDRPGSLAGINILIMLMAPDAFAAEVWLHFSAKGNGCDFMGQLLSGEKAIGRVSP
ncbi:MAG: hypothetical protein NWT12_07465 [Paracoccaceae bacterium]|jgi:hypothetical protein|nr:hypothetical protein [Paracoccaceae bacterium]